MSKSKLYRRIMAMVLSVAMVVGLMPLSAAAETLAGGGEIISFEVLPEDTSNQLVALGTDLDDLDLPDTLSATIRVAVTTDADEQEQSGQEPEQTAEEQAQESEEPEQTAEEPVEENEEPQQAAEESDQDSDSVQQDENQADEQDTEESVQESEKPEQADGEQSQDKVEYKTIETNVPVAWDSVPKYDGDTEGIYVFTANAGNFMVGTKLPEITVTVQAQAGGEITAMDTLEGEIMSQMVMIGTSISDLNLPAQLTSTVDGAQAEVSVKWVSVPEYNGDTEGTYVFSPVLEENYTLAEGISLPAIMVMTMATTLPMLTASRGSSIWDGTTDISWYEGHESDTSYTITTAEQLAGFAELVNGGNDFSGKTFKLGADITLNDVTDLSKWAETAPKNTWTAIGTEGKPFKGIFNGDGHTVSGIYIRSGENYQSLFSRIVDAEIINLGVTDSYINGNNHTAGVVAYSDSSTVKNVCVTNSYIKSSNYHAAGVVENNDSGTVQNCYSTGIVKGYYGLATGIVYFNSGTVQNCYYDKTICGNIGGINKKDVKDQGEGKTTDWMKNATNILGIEGDDSTFNEWDTSIWVFESGKYPYFETSGGSSDEKAPTVESVTPNGTDASTSGDVVITFSEAMDINTAGTVSLDNSVGTLNAGTWSGENKVYTVSYSGLANATEYTITISGFKDAAGNTMTEDTSHAFTTAASSGSSIWDGTTDISWYTGHESQTIYIITTAEQLAGFAELVNGGNDFSGKTVKLGANIVLNDVSDVDSWAETAPDNTWTPIGVQNKPFKGMFAGDGHAVSGIYIRSGENYQSLFSRIVDAEIINLGVTDSYIEGNMYVAGVVAYSDSSTVKNVCVTNSYTNSSYYYAGGVVAYNLSGTIQNCYNTGIVKGYANTGNGVVSYNNGTVTSCYYDKTTCGDIGGINGSDDTGQAEGKTTDWMKNATNTAGIEGDDSTFNEWDTSIWVFESGKYPYFETSGGSSDEKAPTVESVTPNGTDASTSGDVVITFSEAMDINTAGTVSLDNSVGTLNAGTWSGENKVYTVSYSGLASSTAYTITVSGFKDAAGNAMAADSSHTFTTEVQLPNPILNAGTYHINEYPDDTKLVVGNGNDELTGVILQGTNNTMQLTIKDKAEVTFSGVSIIQESESGPYSNHEPGVTIDGTATITLASGTTNTVKSGGGNSAGISVESEKSLTIDGTGMLEVKSGFYGAGIGGGGNTSAGKNCGTIIINDGTVKATGIRAGAGIGGGGGDYSGGAGGTIIINGGMVTATGDSGAGIGGGDGYQGGGGTITINGGTVMATSDLGAGIGGGYNNDDGGIIKILGGIVKATGGMYGAGIGGGCDGAGGSIAITGGIVEAIGGKNGGSGIGGGEDGSGGTVTISNGAKVYASGDTTDASIEDIGHGRRSTKGSGSLTISGTNTKVFVRGSTEFSGTDENYNLNDGIEWTTNSAIISNAQGTAPNKLFDGKTIGGAYAGAVYKNLTQKEAPDEDSAEKLVKAVVEKAVNDSTVEVTITDGDYKEATAGTSADPDGTNGSYSFTVTVKKGDESTTAETITVDIIATEYTDEDAVNDAKKAAAGADYKDYTQEEAPDEDSAKNLVKAVAEKAANDNTVTVTITDGDYKEATAGTSKDPDGTNGSYSFTVTIKKGDESATTETITVDIIATEYTDEDAVNDAKKAAAGADYKDLTQKAAPDEESAQNLVKAVAVKAVNDETVTVTITDGNYKEATAGTSKDPDGTNGSYSFTVTVKKGDESATTETITVDIIATEYTDEDAVNDAKKAAAGADYKDYTQEEASDEDSAKNLVKTVAEKAVNDETVTVTITDSDYKEATAGTSKDPDGTNGSYSFTVTIKKGEQSTTTEKITVAITATSYDGEMTVLYSLNYDEAATIYTTQTVAKDNKTVAPATPKRVGYTFGGWYQEKACENSWDFKDNTVEKSITLFAKWTKKSADTLEVIYMKGGATSGNVPKGRTNYKSGDTVTVLGNVGSLSKNGASFEGWSDGTTTYKEGETFKITDNTVLTAVWIEKEVQCTVSYSNNYEGGGNYTTQIAAYGSLLTKPAKPTREGYTFIGWYKNAECTNPWNFELDTVKDNVTLYTKWAQGTYSVSGTVKDDTNPTPNKVDGATVKIMQGNVQFGETVLTDGDGNFTVSGIPNGQYNIVITKNGQTVTLHIKVDGSDYSYEGQITLPSGNRNSKLEIVGADTPNIVEDGLDNLFKDSEIYDEESKKAVNDGGTVEIRLTVQKNESSLEKEKVSAQMSSDSYKSGMILDVGIEKTVTNNSGAISDQSSITELDDTLTLIIPLPAELQGKRNYVVYRTHDYGASTGVKVDKITTTPNANHEYIEISTDKTYLTLYAKFFSTYVIGYRESSGGNTGGHSSGHSSANQSYSITVTAGDGGSISPSGNVSVVEGKDKTFTFTAKEGYIISDVLIDGKSVGIVDSYTFKNMDAAHTISVKFVKAEGLPYYLNSKGNKVFIGFASSATGTMKYISPEGEKVQLIQNPKNFNDISRHWAKDDIDFVTQREIFVGTKKDKFSPNSGMTRAMFATVIGRLYERSYGNISGNDGTFSDVSDGMYYSTYVGWAEKNGIIKGIGNNKFAPNREITREEMTAILYRFAEFLKVSKESSETKLGYTDVSKIDNWAIESIKYCQKNKIVLGRDDGSFDPQDTATRAEVSTMMKRFVETVVQ